MSIVNAQSGQTAINLNFSFLATGDSYNTLATRFRVGMSTIQKVVNATCAAIWDELQEGYMPVPDINHWRCSEQGFCTKWNFPNCIGAIDGKHVVMQAPNKSGSLYYNYKGTFSVVLMAIVDPWYRFTCVDIGDYGSNADGAIWSKSAFGQALEHGELELPPLKPLPNWPEGGIFPHVFVGDEAFPLKANLMRPYPRARVGVMERMKQIFNYRLSRARRIVENAFGIVAQRFRLFNRRIPLCPMNVDTVIKACCLLHNYLMEEKDTASIMNRLNPEQEPYLQDDGATLDLDNLNGYRSAATVQALRNLFCTYFNRPEGSINWQERIVP